MNNNQFNTEGLERSFTFTYLSDTMLKDNRLDKNDILTALGIAYFVDKHRVSWPGIPAIAKISRLSVRKVQDCISTLEACGYLNVERRKDPKNPCRNIPNLYKIIDVPLVHAVHQGGACDAPGVLHTVHQGGAPHAPEQEPINYNHKQQPTNKLSVVVEKELKRREIEINDTVRVTIDKTLEKGITENQIGEYIDYLVTRIPKNISSKTGWIISQLPKVVEEFLKTQKKADPFDNGGVCPVCKKPFVAGNSICPTCKASIAQMGTPLKYVAQNQGSLDKNIIERWKNALQAKGLYLTPEELKKEQEAGLEALKGLKANYSA